MTLSSEDSKTPIPSFSTAEENYIKNIFELSEGARQGVQTSSLAKRMGLKSASVTQMLKKLKKSDLIAYSPYQKIQLTAKGEKTALLLLRKHRLWESFLHDKLKFDWNEVHEVAEQLEHIKSPKLIEKLEIFLGNPKHDPHGDPIPDKEGKIANPKTDIRIHYCQPGDRVKVVRIFEDNEALYKQLEKHGLQLGSILVVKDKSPFDRSLELIDERGNHLFFSEKLSQAIGVEKI